MKSTYLLIGLLVYLFPLYAQKELTTLTSNLNLSKSNINKLVYPGALINAANATLLLKGLENSNLADQAAMKNWLAANFKRFGVDSSKVKQILIFPLRQYADCTICKKNCKGRCVQDPGSDCVCIHHSDPNLKVADPKSVRATAVTKDEDSSKAGNIIYLSIETIAEEAAIELLAKTISAQKPATKN